MDKLNEKRIKWLVDQVVKKKKLPREVCIVYKVTERRVQQLVKEFDETKRYHILKKNGRLKMHLTKKQKDEITVNTNGRVEIVENEPESVKKTK